MGKPLNRNTPRPPAIYQKDFGTQMVRDAHRFRSMILACVVFLTTLSPAHGATPTLLFHHIDEAMGLPDSTVFQIMQDRDGAMWFGTRNGVARYDGITLTPYQHEEGNPDSLSHNDAGGVLEDRDGAVWVRTWGGGLNRMDPASGRVRVFRNDPANPKSLSEDRVQIHHEDSRGELWAGTFSQGLNRFDRQTESFSRFLATGTPGAISHNRIWSLSETRDQTLWVGTEDGLNRFNRETKTFAVFRHDPKDPASLPHDQIRALCPAGGNTLWVGTPKGFRLFDTQKESCIPFSGMDRMDPRVATGAINALFDDGRMLWVGTQAHGLLILDLETGQSTLHQSVPYLANALSHNDIRWITEDRSGVIWIGTRGGGVNTLSKTRHQMKLFLPGGAGDNLPAAIHAIETEAGGNLWTGSWYTGLKKSASPRGPWEAMGSAPPPMGPGSPEINALALDPEMNLWIGTWDAGLVVRDHRTGRFRNLPVDASRPDTRNITALGAKRAGIIWAGTRTEGLFRHDLATGTVRRFSAGEAAQGGLSSNTIHALLEDDRGTLWVGTDLGLDRIDGDGNRVTRFHHLKGGAESLSNNVVTSLAQTGHDGIWVGTYHGLNRLNPETETIRTYFMEDGLSGNIIKSLVFDGRRRLWVATEKGLSAIDIKDGSITRFPQPLRFGQGAAALSSDGKVIFGGENGYMLFNPEEIPLTRPTAPLHLTGIQLNGTPLLPGQPVGKGPILQGPVDDIERLELAHTENNLTFSFALNDYNDTAENRYRYILSGHDAGWVDAKNVPTARYSQLPPGTYRFRVMAAGSQGVWNESHPGIEIRIREPFWNLWVVKGAAFLLVLGLIRRRTRATANRTRELERLISERTLKLDEQSRLHERLSLTDPLTELLNRRGVQKRERELRSQAQRSGRPHALLLADIDHFKPINDTCGHDCGDFVLQRVSRLLESTLRAHDILGRWGGEEFLLLLPDTGKEDARTLGERIVKLIAEALFEWHGTILTVTLTIGVVACNLNDSFEQSLCKADKALYKGKEMGRNQVVVAPS